MADFKKRLTGHKEATITDPLMIYEGLDRAHDKGPLRPAQIAILTEWHTKRRTSRDVIVKLHTGQGKTLIGLLMLQSRLNETHNPVMYLCPSNILVEQTQTQAKQFGITTVSDDTADAFTLGRHILVTSVHKLFNGKTTFGLRNESFVADTVLLDDAHSCSDAIRDQCRIIIPKNDPAYASVRTLFEEALERQGSGTFAEIQNGKAGDFLPVPYWAWKERAPDVARILADGSDRDTIKFAWPLLKDMLEYCICVVSGTTIEIEPHIPPLSDFGTYWKAAHRIFMSATVTDDAFLIRGLGIPKSAIRDPLTYSKETWSGEKMVLIPSMIDDSLTQSEVVSMFGAPNDKRKSGVVALTPSFQRAENWKNYGALVATPKTIGERLRAILSGEFATTLVLANRYDGIDLPDDACRILVFDGKPHSQNLIDRMHDLCRPLSKTGIVRTVRTIEQGMGRSVRGEKDYSAIVIIGNDLTRVLRDTRARKFLSTQLEAQIAIGLETAELAKQEIEAGTDAKTALRTLIRQCLSRDPDWKDFYKQEMDKISDRPQRADLLALYAAEFEAEQLFMGGNVPKAVAAIQQLIDSKQIDPSDVPWYLQEMARYQFGVDKTESRKLQLAAFTANRSLLKPSQGVTVTPLTLVSQGRMERVIKWSQQFDSYEDLSVALTDVLGRLAFGVDYDEFESALNELSEALGFRGERPDSEWKEGPDNLWALGGNKYILWECKNEVDVQRLHVNKRETEQMNRSCAWFDKHYPGNEVLRVIIHPARKVESAAAFTHDVVGMRVDQLGKLTKNVRECFQALAQSDLADLSPAYMQRCIDDHGLSIPDLTSLYTKQLQDVRS